MKRNNLIHAAVACVLALSCSPASLHSQARGANSVNLMPTAKSSVQDGQSAALRAIFGKASHIVESLVLDAAVFTRSGTRLPTLPERLGNRHVLQLTLRVVREVASTTGPLPETITVRLSAPHLLVRPFVEQLTRARQIFLLKRDYQRPGAPFYYPADGRRFFTGAGDYQQIAEWARQRSASTPAAPPGVQDHYGVPGAVTRVVQQDQRDCWAATLAMMLSWRDQRGYTKEEAVSAAGEEFVQLLRTEGESGGISTAAKEQLLASTGLVGEAPQTFSIAGLRDLLREHGPLWVTVNLGVEDDPDFFLPHARVITAIDGDGTPAGTFLTFVDPDASIERNRETVQEFTDHYEEVGRLDRKAAPAKRSQPFRPQILHF